MRNILAIDLETTGLDPNYHEVTEVACMLLDRKLNTLGEFHSYVWIDYPARGREKLIKTPDGMVDVFQMTGITEKQLQEAPSKRHVVCSLMKWIKKYNGGVDIERNDIVLFGQNVKFDYSFLQSLFQQAEQSFPFDYHTISLESMYAFFHLLTDGSVPEKLSQHTMTEEFKMTNPYEHHATYDIRTSVGIMRWMKKEITDKISKK